jgi:hypothetical protein
MANGSWFGPPLGWFALLEPTITHNTRVKIIDRDVHRMAVLLDGR